MIKLAVLFGGKSTEHNISVASGTSIITHLDKQKYDIYPIYIDLTGNFYRYTKEIETINPLTIDEKVTDIEPITNIYEYLEPIDIVFPVLHGLYGEDGTIQGMLELLGKKYIGCKVLASSLCMDKVYTKVLLKTCNINVAKSMYLQKSETNYLYIDDSFNRTILNNLELQNQVATYLNYPVFIKPSNSGSSVGVNQAHNNQELIHYLEEAFKYDTKVLIEENINGRELECAIIGNTHPIASYVGEVLSADNFYSYESKYKNTQSRTIIPADIPETTMEEIRTLAIKAYLACDCQGLSRVDFFLEKNTNKIILNEINTLPGFTNISMYPKLMEHLGYDYSKLLDKLIELAK